MRTICNLSRRDGQIERLFARNAPCRAPARATYWVSPTFGGTRHDRSTRPGPPTRPTTRPRGTCGASSTCTAGPAFAATWAELQRDLKDGPADEHRPAARRARRSLHAPADFAATADAAGRRGRRRRRDRPAEGVVVLPHAVRPRPARRAARRCCGTTTSPPATRKVQRPRRRCGGRTTLFRKHARGPFADLLNAAVRDPALLVYLDAPANRKGHPNENLARELMELFTLGVGHYTEADVKEAARCLTGWTVDDGKFAEVADAARRRREDHPRQDGQVDRHRPRERCCSKHPATADRLAWRSCATPFFGEKAVPAGGGEGAGRRPARARPRRRLGGRRRSCGRGCSSPTRTSARGCWARSSSSSARRGRWSCSTRPRARWRWPTGPPGWGRTCSTRRTSAAGRAAGPGSAPAA